MDTNHPTMDSGERTTMKITGNTILITGGGSGIGRGLAEAFHKLGNKVIIAGPRKEVLDETLAPDHPMASAILNIEDETRLRSFAQKLTPDLPARNVVMNNAGIMRPENFLTQ